jgi:hypothetical protein
MCYFVFVGVPQVHHEAFAQRMADAGCQIIDTGNVSIRAAFPKGDRVSVVVRNGCSCELYAERGVHFDDDALRARYRRKKWSGAKIERAVVAKRPQERASFAAFRGAIATVVREAGGARIFATSFSGAVDAEIVKVSGRSSMTVEEYLSVGGAFAADVVHDIQAG